MYGNWWSCIGVAMIHAAVAASLVVTLSEVAVSQDRPAAAAGMPTDSVAAETSAADADGENQAAADGVRPGHSWHGEVFNEGPRRAAYLMPGMGNVHFRITTERPMAQRFFDQGLGQLHGFWYFEAERSFRQALAFDPEAPMLYWGLAMANIEQPERGRGFIEQAQRRLDAWPAERGDISDRERRLITMLEDRLREDPSRDKTARLERYTSELEKLVYDYPEDIELMSLLVCQMWQNSGAGIAIQSHVAVDALLDRVFRINPRHPAHHYRIHLWDYRRADKALESAAWCGPSAPGIAHMWHMPGHIYSKLHRYHDAVWQQEASARVDHAHMMRDRVMPDQIHNFAHNNEWLIRNWIHLGDAAAAVDLSCNMTELPRHPRFNALEGRGSARYGHQRLLDALTELRQWQELRRFSDTVYLPADGTIKQQIDRLTWLAVAGFASGDHAAGQEALLALQARLTDTREQLKRLRVDPVRRPPPVELPAGLFAQSEVPPVGDDPPPQSSVSERDDTTSDRAAADLAAATEATLEAGGAAVCGPAEASEAEVADMQQRRRQLEQGVALAEAFELAGQGRYAAALRRAKSVRSRLPVGLDLEWQWLAGQRDAALKGASELIDKRPGEVVPLAVACWLWAEAERWEEAETGFDQLRLVAATAEPGLAVLERLRPLAERLGHGGDWRGVWEPGPDVGPRPDLDRLGPRRWSPQPAPLWHLSDADGKPVGLEDFSGRPLIVVFYLGFGCLHCMEQLQALVPQLERINAEGWDLVCISSESPESLRRGLAGYGQPLPLRLVSNAELDAFRSYGCYDDFEGQPLHGTFLVDAAGQVRWQDIGHEPFMDIAFVLDEFRRLLQLPRTTDSQYDAGAAQPIMEAAAIGR
jgi:peroxiredoxin